jgi:starch-binding outer membrane protein, SusD/RagB family
MKRICSLLAVAALVTGACDFTTTDPNSPGQIGDNPSRANVQDAVAGILLAARSDAPDWNLDAGILGREAYRFDGSDPRFISEWLAGPLDPGGGAFGGDHWSEHYNAIRTTNDLLNVIGTAAALSTAEQRATRGFAETLQAYSFLMVLMAHTDYPAHNGDSIPVDVNQPVSTPPAPLVANTDAYLFVSNLLDSADVELAAGGSAFPFNLPSGFTGFTTPAEFRKFNRGLKAAVEVYRGSLGCGATCYTAALTALGASFVDTLGTITLNRGVYFNFSTGPGDAPNPLFQNPQTGENFVHPSVRDSVETKPGGGNDNRYTAKVVDRQPVTASGLTSDLGWIRYPSTDAEVPILRNEELILLRAEANNALTQPVAAANDVNYIRVASGGLSAIAGLSAQTPAQILGRILRERKYSLLYEGHRWFDLRRTGNLNALILDRAGDQRFATLPVPLSERQARQP